MALYARICDLLLLDLTFEEIAKICNCSIEEVEEVDNAERICG